jgi:hypothetical protein
MVADPRGTDGSGGGPAASTADGADSGEARPLGISLLIWLYWFWAGAVTLVFIVLAVGDGPVMISGRAVPRPEAVASVLPILFPMGLAVIGAALALALGKPWARPAALLPVALAAFGPALSGVGGSAGDVVLGALVVLGVLAVLAWYLYYQPAVKMYFDELKRDRARP